MNLEKILFRFFWCLFIIYVIASGALSISILVTDAPLPAKIFTYPLTILGIIVSLITLAHIHKIITKL